MVDRLQPVPVLKRFALVNLGPCLDEWSELPAGQRAGE
jgi:hypothetical protein